MRYILFGASSCLGVGDYEHGGWAGHLRKYLDTKEKQRYFHNLAISGDNTKGILNRLEREAVLRIRDKPKADWTIFISIGANDSRLEKGVPNTSADDFRANLTAILKKAKELAGTVLVIGGHPVDDSRCNPWRGKHTFSNAQIIKYGEIAKECARDQDVRYLEVFSAISDIRSLTDDGLHPNTKAHRLIFEAIQAQLEQD